MHPPEVTGPNPLQCLQQATPTRSSRSTRPDEDQLLVALAVEWLPYGGPPADQIWERFGISAEHYWHRLCYLLTLRRWLRLLDAPTIARIRTHAMAQFNPSRPQHTPPRTQPTQ